MNNLASQHLCLSWSSVHTSGCRLFLIDSYFTIILYRTGNENDSELPFPPPKETLIRTTMNLLKKERHTIPRVFMIHSGSNEESYFDTLLLEEANSYGPSYSQFLDSDNNSNPQEEVENVKFPWVVVELVGG